ncbi:MAG: hypothetical protein ABIB71_07135 [Candidatus Woesearchaeota archaeon]
MDEINFGKIKEIVNGHEGGETEIPSRADYNPQKNRRTRVSYRANPQDEGCLKFEIEAHFENRELDDLYYNLGDGGYSTSTEVAIVRMHPTLSEIVFEERVSGLNKDIQADLKEIAEKCETEIGMPVLYITF